MALVKSCLSGGLTRIQLEKPRSPSMQLISYDGEFNEAGFKNFLKSIKLHEQDTIVVAIIGLQDSGKSTLMNHLFHTNFEERNANERGPTTKGIWIAKDPLMKQLVIAVDVEGTDGSHRGEDDKTFERQSSVFAALVADVLIINMCCKDVGRDQSANRPLLKVIFEKMEARPKLLHKKTLLFVLRDKTQATPVKLLETDLKRDVEMLWETALKPPGYENTPLAQIFNVEVAALINYEWKQDIFADEVAQLRRRLFDSICPPRQHNVIVPRPEIISFSIMWHKTKRCKDLDLPSHKVMLATVRCEEIAMEKLRLFASNQEWLDLEKAAASSLVSGFSRKISSILNIYRTQYDSECARYEKDVSRAKLEYLISEASKVVRPAYINTLNHQRSGALQSFDAQLIAALNEGGGFAKSVRTCQQSCVRQFDEQCGTDDAIFSKPNDVSTTRRELLRDIKNSWTHARDEKLRQVEEQQRERLSTKFSKKIMNFLNDNSDDDVWGRIRSLLRSESDAAALALSLAVADFELDQRTLDKMVDDLKQKAKELVVNRFKEETQDVLTLLKRRFVIALIPFESAASADKEVNQPTKEDAYLKCVKLLSTVAVIRLDEREGDTVESMLLSALMAAEENDRNSTDPLDSQSWPEEEPPIMSIITPARCRDIWNQFEAEMEKSLAQTMIVQEQCMEDSNWRPFTWVVLGLLVVGSGGFIILISTNITMVMALGYAVEAIGTAMKWLSLAGAGLGILQEGAKLLNAVSEASTFTEFCRKFCKIMKDIKKALRKLYKRLSSILESQEATMATA